MVAGTIGSGGTVYTACKGTLKAQEVLDQAYENKLLIEDASERDEYTEKDKKHDEFIVKVNTGVRIIHILFYSH